MRRQEVRASLIRVQLVFSSVFSSDVTKLFNIHIRRMLISASKIRRIRMQMLLYKSLFYHTGKFSLLVDELTSHSHAGILVLCMRTVVGDAVSPLTFFLDIVELQGAAA